MKITEAFPDGRVITRDLTSDELARHNERQELAQAHAIALAEAEEARRLVVESLHAKLLELGLTTEETAIVLGGQL